MTALFASGRIVDIILALTAIEAAVLVAWHTRTGRGVAPPDLAGTLLSGVFLMVALRCALTSSWWGYIAAWLLAALVAHLADLVRKSRAARPAP